MRYCTRCVYPETSAIKLTFDDRGVCSGCLVAEEREKIDWEPKRKKLDAILEEHRSKDGSNYDCIIPVSGGKDSLFQTHIIKEVYGLNPLLVTFNHTFNTKVGTRNLANMVEKLGCDHIRFTPSPKTVKKLAKLSLKKMGDVCWHCHAGIHTYPVQIAVKFKIPLLIWGEQGYSDLAGMFSAGDMVEMTYRHRKEHALRGYDYNDMVSEEEGITAQELKPFVYPSDEELEEVGVRGIYLGNFLKWNYKAQTELMIEKYGFETAAQERTYTCYENVECHHASGAHDYLKFLKFGYGRASDDAVRDLRLGRLSREEAIDLVMEYDGKRPKDLDLMLKYLNMSEEEFNATIDKMRDPRAWKKDEKGKWVLIDPISNHLKDKNVNDVRLPLKEEKGRREYIQTELTPEHLEDAQHIKHTVI